MTTDEILDDISRIPVPPEYLSSAQNAEASAAQPPTQQPGNAIIPHPTANLPAPSTNYQLPPRPNYAAAAASSGWKQAQSRKGKGKSKQTQNSQAASWNTPTNNNPPAKTQKTRPAPRPETLRTEITVQRPPNSVVTSLNDASLICRRVLAALRSAKSLLPLLSGRWATHSHNYVYTFAGDIPFARITQIAHILLQPFPGGILAPCSGWSRVIFHGTPVSDPDNDAMYTNERLMEEVVRNPICTKLQFILPPAWVRHPDNIVSDTSSISFAFVDRDGEITKTMKKAHLAMFGKPVTFAKWVSRPPLSQCGRCHKLGHISNRCSMPRDSIRCYKCGKGHSAQDHNVRCSRAKSHKVHGICDCEPQCLNCNEKGHYAIDISCKARSAFRIPARDSIDDDIPL
jgi:hypothetical protein